MPIQLALLVTLHAQPAGTATVTAPAPPSLPNAAAPGDITIVQTGVGSAGDRLSSQPAMPSPRAAMSTTTPRRLDFMILTLFTNLWFQGLRTQPQVERFRPRQRLVPEAGERAAASGVLHARPRQRRIEIITAIQVPRAGINTVPDADGRIGITRPDRRRQPISTVVHQRDRLVIALYGHDSDHGAEGLLGHHAHAMIDVDEDLWRDVRGAFRVGREFARVD